MFNPNLILFSLAVAAVALASVDAGKTPYGITVVIQDNDNNNTINAYVATSDSSYAISGGAALDQVNPGLDLISVNDDVIFAYNGTESFTASYKNLDTDTRDTLRNVKGTFNQFLIGLVFVNPKRRYSGTHYITSYDSYASNAYSGYNNNGFIGSSSNYHSGSSYDKEHKQHCTSPTSFYNLDDSMSSQTSHPILTSLSSSLSRSAKLIRGKRDSSSNDPDDPSESDISGIFHFDDRGCPLDIYCSSYSLQSKHSSAIVFSASASIFMYSKSSLPYNIVWFLLVQDRIIFVYADGTVLGKLFSQLDQTELEVVVSARDQAKDSTLILNGGQTVIESM